MANIIEHEGKKYILKEESDRVINGYKDDMHEFKEDNKDLKKAVKDQKKELETSKIKLETAEDKLKNKPDDDTATIKNENAELKGTIKTLTADLKTSGETLTESKVTVRKLSLDSSLRKELATVIHPDSMEDAVSLAERDASVSDEGVVTMGKDGVDMKSYAKSFAEARPKMALAKSAVTAAGQETNSQISNMDIDWKKLSDKEKADLITKDKTLAMKLQSAAVGIKSG